MGPRKVVWLVSMWHYGSKGWDQGSVGRNLGSLRWDQGSLRWDQGQVAILGSCITPTLLRLNLNSMHAISKSLLHLWKLLRDVWDGNIFLGSDITIYRNFEVHDYNKWGTHKPRGSLRTLLSLWVCLRGRRLRGRLRVTLIHQPSSPLLLSSLYASCKTTAFLYYSVFSYMNKVTSSVVTCDNKATVMPLLC